MFHYSDTVCDLIMVYKEDRYMFGAIIGDIVGSRFEFDRGGKTTVRTVSVPQNYSLEVAQLGRCIENGETPFITEDFTVKNAELLDRVLKQIGY